MLIPKIEKVTKEFAALVAEAREQAKQESDAHIRITQRTDINLAEEYFAKSVEYFNRALDQKLINILRKGTL